MALPDKLISDFAKLNKQVEDRNGETTVTGTAKIYDGKVYIQIDGSDQLTPVLSTTAGVKDGDRITALIKNHSVTVTGNTSDPSASSGDLEDTKEEIGSKITEFEIAIGDKVDVIELDAVKGRIDNLETDNINVKDRLTATEADIVDLTAENATITGELTAAKAEIDQLDATKIDASIVESTYATIENLNATNLDVSNLEADYGTFKVLATDRLDAAEATIGNLDATYAKIDFANISEAAVETLFTKSGIIEDLIVSEGHITGHLVGVTISGDLIEGNTIKADKLVVLGSDGLYYKLNVNGESVAAEQTEYNSLNGSIITANTITAEKINVDDLVAFDATIGGFQIDDNSIHTVTKTSVDSAIRGIYMDNDGQIAIGDSANYLKYFKDTDGTYKLDISAQALRLASTGETVEETISKVVKSMVEEFYQSTSPTSLDGGSWSTTQPVWAAGKYIFRRTLVTYVDGSTAYTPSENGVCITGNEGPKGDDGVGVTITSTVTDYQVSANGTEPPTGTWVEAIPTVPQGQFLWTRVRVTYSTNVTTTSYSVSYQGSDGEGKGIASAVVTYRAGASGTTPPEGTWSNTIPTVDPGEYLWTKTVTTYTDGNSTTAYSVGLMGQNGASGTGIASTEVTYQAHSSQTSVPTGEWSSSVPTLSAALPYLWTRTVIMYTDDTTSTAYSVGSTLDSVNVGARNLLLKSDTIYTNDSYTIATYDMTEKMVAGETYTMRIWGEVGEGKKYFLAYLNGGSIQLKTIRPNGDGTFSATFTGKADDTTESDTIHIYAYPSTVTVNSTITKIKLEKGNIATDWSPAPEDAQGSIDDLNSDLSDINSDLYNVNQQVTITTQQINELQTVTDGWELNFNTLTETVTQLGDTVSTNYNEQLKYIRFIDGVIWIGMEPEADQDKFEVSISNDRISFWQNNVEIAYLSNSRLYVTAAQIINRLDLGNFAFFPRDNGNLTFRVNK